MKDVESIIKALESFPGRATILYDSAKNNIVTFQDVVDCIRKLQSESERLNDMKFTQEHCDLYEENEWLKDVLKQYMDGELINEDVFCQQVKELQEVRKYTMKEILTEIGEEACEHHYLNRDCEWFDKVCKKHGVEV